MKVLGCKVDEELYNRINAITDNKSEYIKNLLIEHLNELDQEGNTETYDKSRLTKVNHSINSDEYEMLCKTLDSIPRRLNQIFKEVD